MENNKKKKQNKVITRRISKIRNTNIILDFLLGHPDALFEY